ncbi:MAG: glycerol-3-phosphate acyltransferase [Pleurocapsa sp.]
MNLSPIWGSLTIVLFCPLLGGLPLIDWITYAVTGRHLRRLGTGNVSVSAAFYHGGKFAGILAVLSEAAKGILAVLLTRAFFPTGSVWEIVALIALVMGRYWMGKGAGTTNVVWGIVIHDPVAAGLVFLISIISFTIISDRQTGKLGALVLLAIIIGLRHIRQPEYALATICLAGLIAWIYSQIADDLDLSATAVNPNSQKMFCFFQGANTIITLDDKLDAKKVGQKAANLSLLKRLGYPVPDGWVLPAGEDATALLNFLQPSETEPLVVRSSAIGEDSETASAAGQYLSVLNITSTPALQTAILDCQASYFQDTARAYRQRNYGNARSDENQSMTVLIQKQIEGQYSGVAFSRDPIDPLNQGVAIEALPGKATQVVSGKFNPQRYRIALSQGSSPNSDIAIAQNQINGENSRHSVTGNGKNNEGDNSLTIPYHILESVALLAREMEDIFEGIPQDIEWTYDGEQLWVLQVRPITTLQPIWTRRIAAEVIPGKIRPLTWSINQPLTCGVWGKIFTLVLGDRARDLDFNQTATLHFASAYFNATLLGDIFRRMGLPPESLEFLTRGEKFTKPPLISTIKNLPGLLRLLKREWNLEQDFVRDERKLFSPILSAIEEQPLRELSASEIIARIHTILELLDKVTYYNILAPLSLALRQAILQVPETELNNSQTPEIESIRSLAGLASDARNLLSTEQITMDSSASLFAYLAENPEGASILERFNTWLDNYGYLSEIATDIAIPRWRDNQTIPREMFARFFFDRHQSKQVQRSRSISSASWLAKIVQTRLNLKGKVSEIYNKLLANLRWSFLALEQQWLAEKLIDNAEDIFFLNLTEIETIIASQELQLLQLIPERKRQWQQDRELSSVPYLVYGRPDSHILIPPTTFNSQQQLIGIGTSPGEIEGSIKVVSGLQQINDVDRHTIIVVPYTDAGWSPILARAGGLISEVGGSLSHGAIVAREYHIPAVMDIPNATQRFQDGQKVRINGQTGIVEILE